MIAGSYYFSQAMTAGAHGYLLKDDSESELLAAIRTIRAGVPYISQQLAAIGVGKRVNVNGFGCFWAVERAPRWGRNPKTGVAVPIPPRRVVKFRPGKELFQKIQ